MRRRALLAAIQTESSIPNNNIWYTTSDGRVIKLSSTDVFGANIISNIYYYGMGVINFDGDVIMIGDTAFFNRDELTGVTLPECVTSIGELAFYDCDRLVEFTIPDSVTTIGEKAFYNCESLTSVYCKATTPPSLGNNVFASNGSDRKIYVPAESVSAYKRAEYWSEYASDIVGYNF